MSGASDWDAFVRRHWEREPARLAPGGPALSPDAVFRTVVEACAPFRFGTRFRALPDVKFFSGEAQLRAPGALLPGEEDAGVGDYVRRVASGAGGGRFQLLVEQPFLLDFALWARLRDLVRELLERVGYPVLPVPHELFLGNFARAPQGVTRRPHHAVFLLVLEGRLRVRVWKRLWGTSANETHDFHRHLAEATTLEARAGELLHVPSRAWHLEECPGRCLAVRWWVPVEGSPPADAVQEVLASLMGQELPAARDVPYLPFPGRRRRDGTSPPEPSLVRTARRLTALTHGPELALALRVHWAQRVSACGLEPVPPPRECPPLEDATRVRGLAGGRVVRVRVGPGQWIGAVNGHAFALDASPETVQVLEVLASGAPVRVDELCRAARRAPQRARLRELLETLQALHALEAVTAGED